MPNVYYDAQAIAGANNGTSKLDAFTTLMAALLATGLNDLIWRSHTSIEAIGTIAYPCSGQKVITVDFSGSTPPVAADVTQGGLIDSSGTIQFNGTTPLYFYGVNFEIQLRMNILVSNLIVTIEQATVTFPSASGTIAMDEGVLIFKNVNWVTGGVNNSFDFLDTKGSFFYRGGVVSGANILFIARGLGTMGVMEFDGVDFQVGVNTALTLATDSNGQSLVIFKGCNIPTDKPIVSGTLNRGNVVAIYGSNDSNKPYFMQEEHAEGSIITETTNVKTGGASDGITPISFKYVSNTKAARFTTPLKNRIPILFYAAATGVQDFSVDIMNDGTTFKDDQVWLEFTSPGSGIVRTITDTLPDNVLSVPSDIPPSAATWDETGIGSAVKQQITASFDVEQLGWIEAYICLGEPSEIMYADVKILDGSRQFLAGQAYINGAALTCDNAPVGKVIEGTVYDFGNLTGTYKQLPEDDGKEGSQWGEDGTEFEGTFKQLKGPVKLLKLDTGVKVIKI